MFKKLKTAIKELAKQAVNIAEASLKGEAGIKKKEMAVNYIISHLPVIAPLRIIIAKLMSSFIDDAVELAVEYMKSLTD